MKEQLYVHIPTPCYEDWNKMTPENKGRFCASCAKTVVDFSVMTDNDVLNYLNKSKGNLCGRFADDQLQRPLIETQLQPKKGWKYWLASVASLFVLMNRGGAQGSVANKKTELSVAAKKDGTILKRDTTLEPMQPVILGQLVSTKAVVNEKAKAISGTVVDEKNQPISGATVMIKSLGRGAATDSNGAFVFKNINTNEKLKLTVSFIGYSTREFEADFTNSSGNKVELVKLYKDIMGELVIVSPRKKKPDIAEKIKKDSLLRLIAAPGENKMFKFYPNPVTKNANLQVAIKEAGDYEVQLLNSQSQLLYSRHAVQSKSENVSIPVPANALPGVYYVRLINAKTNKQWVSKVIVQ